MAVGDSGERMAEALTCVAQRIDVAVDKLGSLSAEAVTAVSVLDALVDKTGSGVIAQRDTARCLDALVDVLKRGVEVQERMERRLNDWEERFAPLFDKVQADAGAAPPPAPPTKLRVRKGNKNKKGV
ncbi:MAG: hypothetical protein IT371_30475 [Deltaproteobacteria bacterium]|nr:hypothetical protein [Deltaproteobacteria bacterium]